MIVGIGLDLVKIDRIRAIAERWQTRFLDRLYTEAERRYCLARPEPYASFAGRFAAKEAVLKALGTGWTNGISWHDIQVLNDRAGRPRATVSGRVKTLMNRAGITMIHVSLSHDTDYAVAEVVLTKES
ncbi:MAG: holo-[acyl-carrier-protein] synthase [Nitrospirae bacterium RIFCSPLOWO2_02_FULL_62_14]|nr:MAG: holo-[acyl-carrier-protein] synthase [Nitrospirae bacterium RIFCSPLOWO2_02_FULL_62_14]OGW66582.1 MAG: holo-[acyl-carrier-protein] synthase [Nitrospirae bacterium RIFCSPLOWO2_01_FULL_62_17]